MKKECLKCGKENNITDKFCMQCGNELNDIEITKASKNNKSSLYLIPGIAFIIIGIYALISASSLHMGGEYEKNAYYGGDAYTGMQQASAQTANNVLASGYLTSDGFKVVINIMGLLSISTGSTFIIYSIVKRD